MNNNEFQQFIGYIPGHFTVSSKSFVIKNLSYSIKFEDLKSILLEVSKSDSNVFSDIKDYNILNGTFFHETGIEQNLNVFQFSPNIFKSKHSEEIERKYLKESQLVIYRLNINKSLKDAVRNNIIRIYCENKASAFKIISGYVENKKTTFGNDFIKLFGPISSKIPHFSKYSIKKYRRLLNSVKSSADVDNAIMAMLLKRLNDCVFLYWSFCSSINCAFPIDNIFLIIGANNVATICLEINKTFKVSNDKFSYKNKEQYIFDKCKIIKSEICQSLDGYIDAFSDFDFNTIFGVFKIFALMKKRGETRRSVFIRLHQNNYQFNGIPNNVIMTYTRNVALFYNLLCASVCYYRSISYNSIFQRTLNNDLFYYDNSRGYVNLMERMNWINNKDNNGTMINKAPISDIENFFIDYTTFVYGYIFPVYQAATQNIVQKLLMSDFKNHHLRYRSTVIFYSIATSVIYSTLLLAASSALRIYLARIQKCNSYLTRIPSIKNYAYVYDATLSVYNSFSLYQNHEKIIFYHKIYESLKIEERIRDLKDISEIVWHDANTSNGLIFPFAQTLISIASFIFIAGYNPKGFFCDANPLRIAVASAVAIMVILLPFVIVGIKSKLCVDKKRLPTIDNRFISFYSAFKLTKKNFKIIKLKQRKS